MRHFPSRSNRIAAPLTALRTAATAITLAGVGFASPAFAINDANLGPVEDPAAAGIATVLGGDYEAGCLGTVVDERWILTLDSVVQGTPQSCIGADGTTVQVGDRHFDVVEVVHGASHTRRAGQTITPVMLRVDRPMADVQVNALYPGVVAHTNGTHRGLACTGRKDGELRTSLIEIGSYNSNADGATWYRSENNEGITRWDRGAVLSAPNDAAAPCWVGDRLAAMVAILPTGSVTFARLDELATDGMVDWVDETIASYMPCDLTGEWQKSYDFRADGTVAGRVAVNEIAMWTDGDDFAGRYIGRTASNPSVFTATCDDGIDGPTVRIHQQHGGYWSVIEAARDGDVMTGIWYDVRGNRGDIVLRPW